MLSGGKFVKDGKGNPIEVVGPDGFRSEKSYLQILLNAMMKEKGRRFWYPKSKD